MWLLEYSAVITTMFACVLMFITDKVLDMKLKGNKMKKQVMKSCVIRME